ncbi:unnamed protein product, partial [Boreogadus saida]
MHRVLVPSQLCCPRRRSEVFLQECPGQTSRPANRTGSWDCLRPLRTPAQQCSVRAATALRGEVLAGMLTDSLGQS